MGDGEFRVELIFARGFFSYFISQVGINTCMKVALPLSWSCRLVGFFLFFFVLKNKLKVKTVLCARSIKNLDHTLSRIVSGTPFLGLFVEKFVHDILADAKNCIPFLSLLLPVYQSKDVVEDEIAPGAIW